MPRRTRQKRKPPNVCWILKADTTLLDFLQFFLFDSTPYSGNLEGWAKETLHHEVRDLKMERGNIYAGSGEV